MTITMLKLLRLLREYRPIDRLDTVYHFEDGSIWVVEHKFGSGTERTKIDELLISKKFGFIKWLIREDKIDDGLFSNIMVESELFKNIADLTESDSLIMYLSIEDNPIEFLCSIIK